MRETDPTPEPSEPPKQTRRFVPMSEFLEELSVQEDQEWARLRNLKMLMEEPGTTEDTTDNPDL